MKAREQVTRVDGREIKLTRPEKLLFPADNITKGDLIRYYAAVAERMLPYLQGRPLSMQRFPDGIDSSGFFQKAAAAYYPSWIRTATLSKAGGTVTHVVCDNAATLVYLANQACITLHPWLSRVEAPDHPDQMVFDIDPPPGNSRAAVEATQALKELLDRLSLPAYLKTTGSRGFHVVVPLQGAEDFDSVRDFARSAAQVLVAEHPEFYTMEARKAKRGDRVYLDVNRNGYAQTAVSAYSVRAIPGATVSVPIEWSELGKTAPFSMQATLARLQEQPDPWKDFGRRLANLDKARRAIPHA
jgi:bifunctional non-homologous end joining protein LigD